MRHRCPHPWCRDGRVPIVLRSRGARAAVVGFRRCPSCDGAGLVTDEDEDLRSAGVHVWDRSDEDFRSEPMHWRP